MTNSSQKTRFIELDILRIFALFLILYVHSTDYIGKSTVIEWFRDGGRYIGLGLFVFLSGYGLQYSIIGKEFNPLSFLKKRIMKIYPLYLFSLFLYIFIFHFLNIYHSWWNFSPINQTIFIHIFSLQVIFSPIYPQIYTLWFIGMIVPLYFIFITTATKNNTDFIKYHLGIFSLLVIIRILFQIIDLRFFLYYPIFIIGIIYARKKIINKLQNILIHKNYSKKFGFLSIFLFLVSSSLYIGYKYFLNVPIPIKQFNLEVHLFSYILFFLYTIISINFLILTIYLCSHIFNNKTKLIANSVKFLSAISYPAYLLHRVVYAIAYFLISNKLHLSSKIGMLLFPFVTVILFLVAAMINHLEKSIVPLVADKLSGR